MVKKTNGTKSLMNTGAFKRVFGVLVVLLLASVLMVGAGSAATTHEVGDATALASTLETSEAGDTIKLTADIKLVAKDGTKDKSTPLITIDKDITLNLNGHTISLQEKETVVGTPHMLNLTNGAVVVITGAGTIDATLGNNGAYCINVNNSKLTIESGSFIGGPSAVQVQKGEVIINGGSFALTAPCQSASTASNKLETYLVNSIDKDYADKVAKIIINGGTFKGYNPADVYSEIERPLNFVPVGYSVQYDTTENTYTVLPPVAQIGEKQYATLAEALNDAKDGETVILLKALDAQTAQIAISKNITFDGADKQIAFTSVPTGGAIKITATGDVVLQNLNITAATAGANALIDAYQVNWPENQEAAPQKLTIENSKLVVEGTTGTYAAIKVRPVNELAVTGSEITAKGTGAIYGVWFIPQTDNAKTLNFNSNNLIIESTGMNKAVFGVTISGNVTGLTANIENNELTAKSALRAGLVDYTAVATNTKTTVGGNNLVLEAEESIIHKATISGNAPNTGVTVNLDVKENTAEIKNKDGVFYVISVAQRANYDGEGVTDKLAGSIDNEFTGLTSYVYHITNNLIDPNKPITLDTSGLKIAGQEEAKLEIVLPYDGNGIDISNTSQLTGTFVAKLNGVVTAANWTSSDPVVLPIQQDGSFTLDATGAVDAVTIKAEAMGKTAEVLVTVYKTVTPEVTTQPAVSTDGVATITAVSGESVERETSEVAGGMVVNITSADGTQVLLPISSSSSSGDVIDYSRPTIYISPVIIAPSSPEMPIPIAYSVMTFMNTSAIAGAGSTASFTMPTYNPKYNQSIVDDIADLGTAANKDYNTLGVFAASMSSAEDLAKFDANLTKNGKSIALVLGLPADSLPARLLAFHIDGEITPADVEIAGYEDTSSGRLALVVIYGNSFSSYALVEDATQTNNNGGNGGGSSSSSGSSVWLQEPVTPTEQPTQTPTEEKPTDTVPTDIPSTQPTATPASPGFGILAVLAGLGAVAVLRRQ